MQQEDYIHYDLQTKSIASTTTEARQVVFEDIRNTPIISNSSEYKLSITRFQTDTTLLPVFIPTIELEQDDPDLTILSVTLQKGSNIIQRPIIWEPEFTSVTKPPPTSSTPFGQDRNTTYYYCLNYQHLIRLINKTLLLAMNDLKALDGSLAGVDAPFMGWDTSRLCADLICPVEFDIDTTDSIELFMNRPLWALFTSMSANRGSISETFGRIYKLSISSNNGYNLNAAGKIVLKQNYTTISNWSPVASIVFASNTLPVVPTNISPPLVSLNGVNFPIGSGVSNYIKAITDISVNQQSYKPNLIYNPSAQYRYINLYTAQPISTTSIEVFWKSTNGDYFPLLLPSGGSASIKIIFERKK